MLYRDFKISKRWYKNELVYRYSATHITKNVKMLSFDSEQAVKDAIDRYWHSKGK